MKNLIHLLAKNSLKLLLLAGLAIGITACGQNNSEENPLAEFEKTHDAEYCDEKHIEVFYSDTCSVCNDQKEYLANLEDQSICHVKLLDVHGDSKELFYQVAEEFGLPRSTPITIVGSTIIPGFGGASSTGKVIVDRLETAEKFYTFEDALKNPEQIEIHGKIDGTCSVDGDSNACSTELIPEDNDIKNVPIPFTDKTIDATQFSLPLMSGILGLIDGFNPCAMWVLVMFLIALLQMGDRTKMFVMAGTFILAEGIMYGLILAVWFTAFDFVGMKDWLTVIIGLVAIGAGLFFLYEGIYTDGTCKVASTKQKKKISAQIEKLAKSPLSWGFIGGVLILAFSVNIIEFACSIGIPQSYTAYLSFSNTSIAETFYNILIYIFFYMLDDLVVFGLALWSIEKIGITHKYARAANIIGGILMLILGAIMLFSPDFIKGIG